jgi:hypothetical protein
MHARHEVEIGVIVGGLRHRHQFTPLGLVSDNTPIRIKSRAAELLRRDSEKHLDSSVEQSIKVGAFSVTCRPVLMCTFDQPI